MANVGITPKFGNLSYQTGTGDGSDTTPIATLDYTVATPQSISVSLDGLVQVPVTDYDATGTTLTFVVAPPNGVAILVVYLGLTISIGTPADNTVGLAQLAGGTDGEIITFDSSGDPAMVGAGTSGQVLTSNGAGAAPTMQTASGGVPVVFPATRVGDADPNTLDDYEEGTFTPTIQDSTGSDSESQTYGSVKGTYVKIGQLVQCWGYMSLTSFGSLTGGDAARLAGLPFASFNNSPERFSGGMTDAGGLAISAGNAVTGYLSNNVTYGLFNEWNATTGTTTLTVTEVSTAATFGFWFLYRTDS